MLGSELEKRGVRSYSVAFPGGDPADYLIDLNQFYPKLKDSKVIVFFFEGNDFPLALNVWNQESALSRFKKSFQRAIGDFYTFRFGYVNYIRLRYALSHTQSQKATTVDIHGEKMGFSPDYVAVTKRETYAPPANFIDLYKKNSNKISAIVFIPEKYRVYADIGAVAGPEHLPNAQWDFTKKLGEQAHIPVYNLTTSLEAEARKQLSEQKFLWWKDDTHWNRTGIAAAATELQTIIPTLKSVQ